jgi:hypothetical protein
MVGSIGAEHPARQKMQTTQLKIIIKRLVLIMQTSRRFKIQIALAMIAAYFSWILLPRSYIKYCWQYDLPPDSRLGIARYFALSKCLRGKSMAEVREMLAF